ncbi:Rab2a [Hexamita inflata]|uniref:Rab2a n=2 Tax=Hexamita inflata TaxID=28002 RepID=A0AA86QRI1_9EUKA|nr:Rab2a [Hexamita inflata]
MVLLLSQSTNIRYTTQIYKAAKYSNFTNTDKTKFILINPLQTTETLIDIRVALVGDTCVGKSSISQRYIENKFDPNITSTSGASFLRKLLNINNTNIKLQIWDTAGQEKFRALTPMYYRSAELIFIVFDVSREESFKSVPYWLNEIKDKSKPTAVIILAGNKTDIENRAVKSEEAELFARQNNILYLDCSAKSGNGVQALFDVGIKIRLSQIDALQDSAKQQKVVKEVSRQDCCM